MNELIIAIGLVLVIEGLPWVLAPRFATKVLQAVSTTPENSLRLAGLLAITAGFALVWYVRG